MRLRSALVPLALALPMLATGTTSALAQTASPCAPGGPTAQYPPSACGLTVAASQVPPGTPLPVSGSGFAPNSRVTIEFRSAPVTLGAAQADSANTFATTVMIPADAAPGTHTLAAMGTDPLGRPRELTATITVLGGTTSRGADLPRTGTGLTLPAAGAGLALTVVGGLLVAAVRRRRGAA